MTHARASSSETLPAELKRTPAAETHVLPQRHDHQNKAARSFGLVEDGEDVLAGQFVRTDAEPGSAPASAAALASSRRKLRMDGGVSAAERRGPGRGTLG